MDPTAAVSPARVESGVASAIPESEALPILRGDHPWLRNARMTWDSLANSWNQMVLGYTPDRQRQLMRQIGIDDATWRSMVMLMLIAAGIVTLVLTAYLLRRLHVTRPDPVIAAYARFCANLERRGVERHRSEGPDAFCRRACAAVPELAPSINTISNGYIRLRYGSDAQPADVLTLQREVNLLRGRKYARPARRAAA